MVSDNDNVDGFVELAIEIISNPPEGVDLTLVGGQAVIYWTLLYYELYPECFTEENMAATQDVDYVVGAMADCQRCHEHWGGELQVVKSEDMTPELGVITIPVPGEDTPLQIDLLGSLIKLERAEIKKLRVPFGESTDFYVLSEWGVLLNRLHNTLGLKKYQGSQGIAQLLNAVDIFRASIIHLAATDRPEEARNRVRLLLGLAKSKDGMNLLVYHGVNLLSAIPEDVGFLDARFYKSSFLPEWRRIVGKQERLIDDAERRGNISAEVAVTLRERLVKI